MRNVALTAVVACWVVCAGCGGEAVLRRTLTQTSGVVRLPAGTIEIHSELVIPVDARDLEIRGSSPGTLLRAAGDFRGRAIFVVRSAARIHFSNFTIDGNRRALEKPAGLPPSNVPFVNFYTNNGVLAEDIDGLTVSDVRFRNVAGFPILVARSSEVLIENIQIEDSGSKNAKGRNNTSGGILLEEGTSGFQVLNCRMRNVRGNGVWTHSLYTSPRNMDGFIAGNRFESIGRDAIQVGHATNVRVEDNSGRHIGYPFAEVDVEGGGIPVAIDTAGNVDQTVYTRNRFEEVNGKCIDLDGFHNGEVHANTCTNRGSAEDYPHGHYGIVFNNSNPDMRSENVVVSENVIDGAKFGGIFVIGAGHTIERNRLLNLNKARCNENAAKFGCLYFPGEPNLLRTGIYLGRGAERPAVARNNVVTDNEISGHGMKTWCIGAAPGVSLARNTIRRNQCSNLTVERQDSPPR